ncbi:hypothetical protein Tco_0722086 [Tanacetum coccineum]
MSRPRIPSLGSYNKGWMSFIKHPDAAPVCHIKPLDSVKNWNDHFFWVDSKAFPLSVSLKSKILSKDPSPKLSQYDTEECEFLRIHTAPFQKFPKPFLCWVGISRFYTLDENSYSTFWDGDEEMDLFAFIRHSDPTKVRVGERNLADTELKLLKMTKGHTVALDPLTTVASGGSSDSIDRLFDEGDNAGQEHPAKNMMMFRRKLLLKMLQKDDHQSLPPSTDGKSLSALRGIVLEGAVIPSDAARPLTRPPHKRYVVSSDSSHHSGSYYEAASLIRSAADVPVVTVAVTTTVDANVATGSKAKDAPKDFEHIGDSASAASILKPSRVYVLRWKLHAMDYDQLYSEFNVGATWQVCLGAETALLSERDAEIAHLKSLLSLKEVEAAEAISLRSQLSVVEAADAARDVELASLSSQVANLTADLFGFRLSRNELNSKVASLESEKDCLATQKSSLESALELFKEQVEKMQDKHMRALSERVAAIDSDLLEMVLQMDAEFYPRYLTTIAGRSHAIDKGMQDGLVAGIKHGTAGRSITNVVAFNSSTEGDYVAAINTLQEVAHNRLLWLRGDAAARRLSLTDSMLPLIEPLSARNLTGEASPSADVATAVTTALSTTFAQTYLVSEMLSTLVLPSPKVVFEEEEELDTMPEHAPVL